ncbi:MAG: hypothetical protein N0C88_01040 [Candidatus Thiodiazotropha lotti]|uniref:Uncharacterized protein n=1 Tax=Candidatus Thiodiazotropha lotti TaxID=2792787 RepID=A0A9E4MZ76_9GAMM|nr:hypothetical protein [Candidatus Thiodiazotropha lotti]MCW4201896.1 hypothetical protein [Candidatus Thiodiazotropha lotti]
MHHAYENRNSPQDSGLAKNNLACPNYTISTDSQSKYPTPWSYLDIANSYDMAQLKILDRDCSGITSSLPALFLHHHQIPDLWFLRSAQVLQSNPPFCGVSRSEPADCYTRPHWDPIDLETSSKTKQQKNMDKSSKQMRNHRQSQELQLEQSSQLSSNTHDDKPEQDELKSQSPKKMMEMKNELEDIKNSQLERVNEVKLEVKTLKKRIEEKELSRQRLQREKIALAESLKAETAHNLRFVEQTKSLDDRIEGLEQALKARTQIIRETEELHSKALENVNQKLESANQNIQALKESQSLLESTIEYQNSEFSQLQESNQALVAEHQQAKEGQLRNQSEVTALKQQLRDSQDKSNRQLATVRAQAQRDSESLQQQMTHTMESALEAKQQQTDELQTRLNNEIKALELELDRTRTNTKQQLSEARHKAQTDLQELQEDMTLTLEQAVQAEQQQAMEVQGRLGNEIELLKQTVETIQSDADQQLDEARYQTEQEIISLKQQMNLAVESEKQKLESELTHFMAMNEDLKKELQEKQATAERQLDELKQLTKTELTSLREQMILAKDQAVLAERARSTEEKTTLQDELDVLNKKLFEIEREHSVELDQVREQARRGSQLDLDRMSQALEAEKQIALDQQMQLTAENESLNQQLQITRDQIDQQLSAVTQKAKQDYNKLRMQMDEALENEKQQANLELTGLQVKVEELTHQLQLLESESEKQLKDEQQKAQVEYSRLEEQLNLALESGKLKLKEEKVRFEAESQHLNEQLNRVRSETEREQQKRLNQEDLLQQERNTIRLLKDQLQETEKVLRDTEERMAATADEDQKIIIELKKQLEIHLTEVNSEEAAHDYQQLSAQKDELISEVTALQAQLDNQQQTQVEIIHSLEGEKAALEENLNKYQGEAKMAKTTIHIMKKNQDSLSLEKEQLAKQLDEQKTETIAIQAELKASLESIQQENGSLRHQLATATSQNRDEDTLQRAHQENRLLKQKIKGLKEVQLEMERQLNADGGVEIKSVLDELKATQLKLGKAEKLAQQRDLLLRENQIHESAIEILSQDLDSIVLEKESLIEECDYLRNELHYLKAGNSNNGEKGVSAE